MLSFHFVKTNTESCLRSLDVIVPVRTQATSIDLRLKWDERNTAVSASTPPSLFMSHSAAQPRHKSDQRGDVSIRRNGSRTEIDG